MVLERSATLTAELAQAAQDTSGVLALGGDSRLGRCG